MVSSHLSCVDELQRSEGDLQIGSVGLEIVQSTGDVLLQLGGVLPRRAVGGDLVQRGRHGCYSFGWGCERVKRELKSALMMLKNRVVALQKVLGIEYQKANAQKAGFVCAWATFLRARRAGELISIKTMWLMKTWLEF